MPTVDDIIDAVLQRELGPDQRGQPWASIKARAGAADRGGWTRAGITVATLGEWRRLGRQATRSELDSMSEQECRDIYRQRYLGPFEPVPDPLRALLVDWAVTSGHDDPTRALQRSLRARNIYGGPVDGVFGAMTREALGHDPDQHRTYCDVLDARFEHYDHLALDEPVTRHFLSEHPEAQLHNLRGWQRRTREFML